MRFVKVFPFSLLARLLIVFAISGIAFAQADNDNFEDAFELGGDRGTFEAFVLNATKQQGEPEIPELIFGSVWFKWMSPTNGTLQLSRESAAFPNGLQTVAFFRGGSLNSILRTTNTSNSDFPFSRLRVPVAAHQTIWIAVGADDPSGPTSFDRLTISYRFDPSPQHDNSTRAAVLTGDDFEWELRAAGGTSDAVERSLNFPGDTPVVWYRWTSAAPALCALWVDGHRVPSTVQVFRRNSNQTLQRVQINVPFEFNTSAGTTYYLGIQEENWRPMIFRLIATYQLSLEGFVANKKELSAPQDFVIRSLGYLPQDQISSYSVSLHYPFSFVLETNRVVDYIMPSLASGQYPIFVQATTPSGRIYRLPSTVLTVRLPNDRFEQRTELAGSELTFDADLRGATPDQLDSTGIPSAWWRWRAGFSGRLVLEPNILPPAVDTRIFQWSSTAGLTLVNKDEIQEGQEYAIAVYNRWADSRFPVHLSLVKNDFPHDEFSKRQVITRTPFVERLRSERLTAEAGEPAGYYASAARRTAWYTFTAPEDGDLTVGSVPHPDQVFNYDFSFAGEVYLGTTLSNLVMARSLSRPNSFRVHKGETYQIRGVFPPYDDWLSPLFYCAFDASPTNDWFASAQHLSGSHLSIPTSLLGSATETNEPPLQTSSGLAPTRSIWFRWIAPKDGNVSVFVQRSAPTNVIVATPVIQMYHVQSPGFSGLTPLPPGPLPETGSMFGVTAGRTYAIRLADYPAKPSISSNLVLELHLAEVGATFQDGRDDFSLATSSSLVITNDGISPHGLTHFLKLYSSDPATIDGAIQGWGRFPLHTNQASGTFSFEAWTPGRYWLAIVSSNQLGELAYSRPVPVVLRPENDDFSEAYEVTGNVTNAWIGTAGVELNEPLSAQTYRAGTVWFSWTAPADGMVSVQSFSATSVIAYEGDTISNLSQVAPIEGSASKLSFYALVGHRYRFQVASSAIPIPSQNRPVTFTLGQTSPTLNWSPQPSPWVIPVGTSVDLSFDLVNRADDIAEVWFQVGDQKLQGPAAAPFTIPFTSHAPGSYAVQAFMRLGSGFTVSSPKSTLLISVPNGIAGSALPLVSPSGLLKIDPPFGGPISPNFAAEQWFSWQAPETGAWFVEAAKVQFLAGPIELYQGNPTVNPVAIPSQSGYEPAPWMAYSVQAGVDYYIRVLSHSTDSSFELPYFFATNPPNDAFANATPVEGHQFAVESFALLATTEPQEEVLGRIPRRTLWWSWHGDRDGLLKLSGNRPINLFLGAELGSLVPQQSIAGALGITVYRVQAGKTYRIMVENEDWPATRVFLEGRLGDVPTNDDFAKATVLSGRLLSFQGSLAGASVETDEPFLPTPTAGTVWWTWTAPQTGEAQFIQDGYQGCCSLSAFEGTNLVDLTRLAADINRVHFAAIEGKQYYLRFSSSVPVGADLSFRLIQATMPPNDQFAFRRRLVGSSVQASSWTYGATREFQEPWHAGIYGGRSSWFEWNPPWSGHVTLGIEGGFLGLIGVYRGAQLQSLQEVARGIGPLPLELEFDVTQGTSILIAVDSGNGEWGDYHLSIRVSDPLQLQIVFDSNQALKLKASGLTGQMIAIESSNDLIQWTVWQTVSPTPGTTEATVPLPPAIDGSRFFRLRDAR